MTFFQDEQAVEYLRQRHGRDLPCITVQADEDAGIHTFLLTHAELVDLLGPGLRYSIALEQLNTLLSLAAFREAIETPGGIDKAIAQLYASGRITAEFVDAEVNRRIAEDDF